MKVFSLVFLTIIALTMKLPVLAQFESAEFSLSDDKRKMIESQKVSFITAELMLTPEEAEVFWPVYKKFQERKSAEKKEFFRKYKALREGNMTDELAAKLLDLRVKDEQSDVLYETEFQESMSKILPLQKIVRLYEAEFKFRKELMKRLQGPMSEGERWHGNRPAW